MAATLNATSRLGAFVTEMAGAELVPDIAAKAAVCLLDPLGLALAARWEPRAVAARSMTTRVPEGRFAVSGTPPGEAGGLAAEVSALARNGGSRPVRMRLDRIAGSHEEGER
jgi:2-methylcitrate dehydratase PrpD